MEASVSTSNKTLWKSEENTLIKDNEEGSHANKIEDMNKKMKQIRLKGWCWKVSLIRLTGRAKDLMYLSATSNPLYHLTDWCKLPKLVVFKRITVIIKLVLIFTNQVSVIMSLM